MNQQQYHQTLVQAERAYFESDEISFLANIERTGNSSGDGIEIDYPIEILVSGIVLFDESAPAFVVEDFSASIEDGTEQDLTDDEYRKFSFRLIEMYMAKEK